MWEGLFCFILYVGECSNGATLIAHNPSRTILVCKDDLQQTCEKDFSVLCPPGFELCSPQKYNNNNRGWNGASPIELLGKIYCRDSGGAGQVYLNGKYTMSLKESLQRDSSLSDCPSTNRGCDRKTSAALCCISTPGKNQRDAYFLKTNSVP